MTAAVPLGALAVARIAAGRLAERFGRRRVLMVAAVLLRLAERWIAGAMIERSGC